MKLRIFAMAISILAMAIGCPAQKSTSPRPKWLNNLPTPTNNTFRYELHTSVAPSLDGARTKAIDNLISSSGLKNGVVVMSETSSNRKLNQHWVNGKLTEIYDVDHNTKTDIKSSSQTLYIEKVAEYWETTRRGILPYRSLCQIRAWSCSIVRQCIIDTLLRRERSMALYAHTWLGTNLQGFHSQRLRNSRNDGNLRCRYHCHRQPTGRLCKENKAHPRRIANQVVPQQARPLGYGTKHMYRCNGGSISIQPNRRPGCTGC